MHTTPGTDATLGSNAASGPKAPPNPDATPAPYRLPGLDGLRAIGAVAVLFYHLVPTHVPGGFTGVDVFFVLSGFLITSILIRQQERSNTIRIGRFWLKRFRRLFPAVAATSVVMIPIAALVSTDLLVGIRRQFFGSVTFTYNWVQIAHGTSYFETQVPELLRNMWSLAVEQQFYVLWPLVLVLILKLPYRWRALGPAVLASAALVEMLVLVKTGHDLSRVYEGTDTHMFGLMLGAMVALIAPHPMRALTTRERAAQLPRVTWIRGWASWLGLGLVVLCFFIVDDAATWTYPWGLLLSSLGSVMLIQGMLDSVSGQRGPGRVLARVLEFRPLVWLGERSYSVYLWHWPILVVLRMAFPQLGVWWMALLVSALTIAAATASYHLVENPMRYHGIVPTLKVWFGLTGPAAKATKPTDSQAQPVPSGQRVATSAGSEGGTVREARKAHEGSDHHE